jgi:hypothetical protein
VAVVPPQLEGRAVDHEQVEISVPVRVRQCRAFNRAFGHLQPFHPQPRVVLDETLRASGGGAQQEQERGGGELLPVEQVLYWTTS